jgi:hypothetical protein
MVENGTNGARTETAGTPGGGRRPFIFGAIAGAVVAALVAVVLVLTLSDDDSSSSSSTSTSSSPSVPPTTLSPPPTSTAPPPTTTRPPNLPPPAINGFGISLQNCPQGASSTTVNISYSARNAEEVQFAVDDDVVQSTTQLNGNEDVGPVPCDGENHTLTVIAISDGLRATRDATVAVSTNKAITVQ